MIRWWCGVCCDPLIFPIVRNRAVMGCTGPCWSLSKPNLSGYGYGPTFIFQNGHLSNVCQARVSADRILASSWHRSPFSYCRESGPRPSLRPDKFSSPFLIWAGLGLDAYHGHSYLISKWSSKLILTLSSKEIQSVDLTNHQINIWSRSSCGEKKAPSGMPEMMGNFYCLWQYQHSQWTDFIWVVVPHKIIFFFLSSYL